MTSDNLKPCWRCKSTGIYVDSKGYALLSGRTSKNVSCNNSTCMGFEEYYTVKDWHNHPRTPEDYKYKEVIDALAEELEAILRELNDGDIDGAVIQQISTDIRAALKLAGREVKL